MRITQDHLDRLVCPVCHGRLVLAASEGAIHCESCRRSYPIVDGLPVLLAERASPSAP